MALGDKLIKSIDEATNLLLKAKYVVGITGAGASVESGIRPFRGPGGIWTEHGEPPLDGFQRFMADPKKGWEKMISGDEDSPAGGAAELLKALMSAEPNPGHYAMAELEELGVMKYLITQNVDNLHRAAGSKNVAEIHGNMKLLRCMKCGSRYKMEEISLEVLPPQCPKCKGTVKTDGVMFGEPIPSDILAICQTETDKCDCMLSAGTSAFVYPAAGFPQIVKRKGGLLIEIDLYGTPLTQIADVSIRGKFGEVLPELVKSVKARMGNA